MIIAASWVFSLLFNIPLFLAMDIRKKKNRTYRVEIFPKRWMAMAYSLVWLFLIVLSLAMMVVLYSRVVYTLWFKHDDDNQLTCQQRVSRFLVNLIYPGVKAVLIILEPTCKSNRLLFNITAPSEGLFSLITEMIGNADQMRYFHEI